MPKLWTATIAGHRREVREAILAATAAIVADGGLRSVTMSSVATKAGIGRATLYKYFADVEAVLLAWHEVHVAAHLRDLAALAGSGTDPVECLSAVLTAYAHLQHAHPTGDPVAFLHRGKHVEHAQDDVRALLRDLVAESVRVGQIRDDVVPEDLASYCLHALQAAANLRSKRAVGQLVAIVLAGLRSSAKARVDEKGGSFPARAAGQRLSHLPRRRRHT